MVKPSRIIVLLGYIAAMAGLIMLMSPEEIRLSDDLSFKIFTFKDLLPTRQEKVDMSAVEVLQDKIDSLENTEATDSVASKEVKTEKIVPQKLNKFIQFPENNPNVLDDFFASLNNDVEKELIRIVHYGDSQIEGDRITEYLRNRMQKRFGGCGVGMIPPTEIKGIRSTMAFEATENFVRYEIFGAVKKPSLHRDYGYLGSYHKFAYQRGDTAKRVRGNLIYLKPFIKTYDKIYQVERVTIGYRNRFAPLAFYGNWNGEKKSDSVQSSGDFKVWQQDVATPLKRFQMELFSQGDPEIYGVAFDCKTGIALDNAAFRGSSGIEFTSVNKEIMKQQVEKLNIKLMVLQFGVNVIPYVRKEYGYHKTVFKKQLQFLKSLSPDLNILVIGPSDMAHKRGTSFVSYPNIPALRDAMKEAAFESDCAFWDLYDAMGGKNSIIGWVDSKPALANQDYTHFTRKGAKLVGEMLYNSLMKAYNEYQVKSK